MPLQTTSSDLEILTKSFTYKTFGDGYEMQYGDLVIDNFSNSEAFWQKFITPLTNRIDAFISNSNDKIKQRQSASLDVRDLSAIHYSVFMNLTYAVECLTKKQISYFENFYAHLGSVCDLAEEFLTQLYFISLYCEGKETEILQRLS